MQSGHRGVLYFDSDRVRIGVDRRAHAQALGGGRACNEVDYHLKAFEWPERVNDFAAPGVMNLLRRAVVFSGWRSPMRAG